MKSTMKKIVGIASTVLLGGMLAACGNGSDSGGASSGDKGFVGNRYAYKISRTLDCRWKQYGR